MNETASTNARTLFLDKAHIQHTVALQNAKRGFTPDRSATPHEAQKAVERSLRDNGLAPEDNIFSCGITAVREE